MTGCSLRETEAVLAALGVERSYQAIFQWVHRLTDSSLDPPTAKPEVLDQWRDALPQLEGHATAFEDRGHFIKERKPAAVAGAISNVAGLD